MTDTGMQRVAVVTGAAVRVGRAIALALAEDGFDIVGAYGRSEKEARSLCVAIETLGRTCVLVQADLRTPEGAEQVAAAALDFNTAVDVLVNSAASFRTGRLEDVDAAEWDAAMALNARAPHLLTRALLPGLRSARGCVVNITDLGAFEAWTERPHHAVSKAALAHLTRVQAKSYAPDVRVNAIAPGAVLAPDDWTEEMWERVVEKAPLKRGGSPADVVRAVRYLVEADYVTGQILAVDGGRLL